MIPVFILLFMTAMARRTLRVSRTRSAGLGNRDLSNFQLGQYKLPESIFLLAEVDIFAYFQNVGFASEFDTLTLKITSQWCSTSIPGNLTQISLAPACLGIIGFVIM